MAYKRPRLSTDIQYLNERVIHQDAIIVSLRAKLEDSEAENKRLQLMISNLDAADVAR